MESGIGPQGLVDHPVFKEAIADLEALGVRVWTDPMPNAVPYAIIGGRSNARWWLLPLQNRHVTSSGLALFQPLLRSAQWMKRAAASLTCMGLSSLWAKPKFYLSGEPTVAQYFGRSRLSYAYFTGTASPHRKVAIQIMDEDGNLKGFAKLTRNKQVRKLLMHEAATLKNVNGLALQTAHVPKVLFAGDIGDSTLLVTDTLKSPRTPTTTRFTAAHRAFIQELSRKTAATHPTLAADIARDFRVRFNLIHPHIKMTWRERLDAAVSTLEALSMHELNVGLSHGDFTPWNTFVADARLYVFDWEYAEQARPASNDIIHFVLNQPQVRTLPPHAKIDAAMTSLLQPWTDIPSEAGRTLMMTYLLTQSLRQIERLPPNMLHSEAWDGAEETASMFDHLQTTRTAIAQA